MIEGVADSGMLDSDLTDLFVALGDAARDHGKGVVLLLDEIQFLNVGQLEALIAAMHRMVQRALPITLVAAGLPQIPELAGESQVLRGALVQVPHHRQALAPRRQGCPCRSGAAARGELR